MGLLLNQFFWAALSSAIESATADPTPLSVQSELVASIVNDAFGNLIHDPDIKEDIATVFSFNEQRLPRLDPVAFETFLMIERKVLRDAGATEHVIKSIERYIRQANRPSVKPVDAEQFFAQIAEMAERSSGDPSSFLAFELDYPHRRRRTRLEVTKRTVGGVLLMSANAGSATALSVAFPVSGVIAGLAAAYSVESGRKIWMDAWRGRW